ncbi:aromatic amino acid lyase [[Brevibacterium] frigoritolerans]|uniref:Aromatic amino acid lyase n=1 Tax=Peribacillus frigoritolerans TaxID=450367 RepID=A0A941FIX3_9BACI|nr:aromatic amino acid lyase [Peribacillus frigoritolerans]
MEKHEEQAKTARNVSRILEGSQIIDAYKEHRLQDALSLRCIPQVHGAIKEY